MPRDSGGTYTLPSGNPVVTGTVISSTVQNNTTSDIATALTQSIASTGVTTPTANLPMGGYKHTGAAIGSALTDYAILQNIQNGSVTYVGTVGGTANAITLTPSPAISAYAAGQRFYFLAPGTNSGAVTVATSGLTARALKKHGTTALIGNEIPSGALVEIFDDGTNYQLINVLGYEPGGVDVAVADGGTGLSTLTANNVILGNGTSTPSFVAPGSSGNVLTSNGTTWSSSAISITAASLPSGSVVQVVNLLYATTTSTASSTMPLDDTIPQITEGAEMFTQSFTPLFSTSKLFIDVLINASDGGTGNKMRAALFQDATADALSAVMGINQYAANYPNQFALKHYMTAGTTSAITFRIRMGGQGDTITLNAISGTRVFGGVQNCVMTIWEIKA